MDTQVYLVGAGPGDKKLITLKGKEAIEKADVIIYDRLINDKLLDYRKENCELIYAGKKANNHFLTQDETNRAIVENALAGKVVTRLKGGDPYVFGRGGEEAIELLKEDISFEVIPGISSSIAALNYAGIPITYRNVSRSFHVMTAHFSKDSDKTLDFESISKLKGTLVFLMGIGNLEKISKKLVENNMSPNTPVAVIQWGTYSYQNVAKGTLETIVEEVKKQKVKTPGIIVVGDVVNLRDKLNYFENKPLFGSNIGITRPTKQNNSLVEAVVELGGNPVEIPSIEVNKINKDLLDNSIENIDNYDLVVFTSVNAVEIFFNRIFKNKMDLRILGTLKFAVVGKSTYSKLKEFGIYADFMPETFVGEDLGRLLNNELKENSKILLPRSQRGRKKLLDILSKKHNVDEIHIYNINQPKIDFNVNDVDLDYLTFTSPSTFNNFYDRVEKDYFENVKVISIGPITSKAIKEKNIKIYKQAKEYSINGIIDCFKGE